MDHRVLDKKAEELRAKGAELAAKGADVTSEERDLLMRITGELNQLDELRLQARDDELEEARTIAARGLAIGSVAGETPEDNEARTAWRDYIKSGIESRALASGSDAGGGYIVPEPVHGPLIEKYRNVSPLLQDCTTFQMGGDTKMYLPFKATHGVVGNATETGARAETTEPTFANIVLNAGDYYSDQRATQTFLDSAAGAEDWVMQSIYEDFAAQLNADIAVGAGTNNTAAGLFAASSTYQTMLSGVAAALANTNFTTLFFGLPQKYRPMAKWYMSPATLSVLMAMAMPNLNNTPLVYTKPTGGFSILGKDVVEVDDAPAISATAYPVAFGDLSKAYAVGIHHSLSVLRDPYTATPNVRFYGLARMGGVPWDPWALKLLKSNAS